jgi:hypothetical protein
MINENLNSLGLPQAVIVVGSGVLLGGWLLLHNYLESFGTDSETSDFESSDGAEYVLNKPLFPQPINMILRFVLRLLDKLAYCFEALGFVTLKQKVDDYGLRLFMFFFIRAHGDVLGYGCSSKTCNPPNNYSTSPKAV